MPEHRNDVGDSALPLSVYQGEDRPNGLRVNVAAPGVWELQYWTETEFYSLSDAERPGDAIHHRNLYIRLVPVSVENVCLKTICESRVPRALVGGSLRHR